jgi:hypothetical protein
MPALGAVILVAFAGYFGFTAADTMGLEPRRETVTVTSKEHVPAGTTYRTELIAGKTRTVPHAKPEQHILTFRVSGKEAEYPVERDLYESVSNGDQVEITYQQRRITGGVQVLSVKGR